MNPEDKKLLDAALAILTGMSAIGRHKIDSKLDKLEPLELQKLFDATKPAFDAKKPASWNEAARAWLIVKFAVQFISRYGWSDPSAPELQAVRRLMPKSEPELRADLLRLVTGADTAKQLVDLQNNAARNAWQPGPFTAAAHHDPAKFCYVISALRPTTGLGIPSADQKARYDFMKTKLDGVLDVGTDKAWTLRSAELYLKNPGTLLGDVICCSLIDQTHTRTYGKFAFGFILSVPKQNICCAADGDLASSINSVAREDMLKLCATPVARAVQVDDFVEQLRDMYKAPLPTPQQIIAGSRGKNVHNEVIVLGSQPSGMVHVTGIFMKVTKANKMLASFIAEDAQYSLRKLILDCTETLHIPIVTIPSDAEGSSIDFDVWVTGAVEAGSKAPAKSEAMPVAKPVASSVGATGATTSSSGPQAQSASMAAALNALVAPQLRPGDLVRFLQRISPDRYCVARVLDANQPPVWNGAAQWPGHRPTNPSPGAPAVYSSRPQWSAVPIQYVWVQAVRYEPANSPAEVGYLYDPDIGSLTPVQA